MVSKRREEPIPCQSSGNDTAKPNTSVSTKRNKKRRREKESRQTLADVVKSGVNGLVKSEHGGLEDLIGV
jgi:hypothetical protein